MMSAPTELNTAMNEVPIPEINMSNEEVIVDVKALKHEAQKAMEALLATAQAKNDEIVCKQKEKEDNLAEERRQAEAKQVADEAKWVTDEAKWVVDKVAAKKKADDEAAEVKRLAEAKVRKMVSLRKTVVEVGGLGEGATNLGPQVRVEDQEVVQAISAILLTGFTILTNRSSGSRNSWRHVAPQ